MRITSADLLEFQALKDLVGRYVGSPLGRAPLDRLEPGTGRAELESVLADTGEAIEYLKSASQPQRAVRGSAMRIRFGDLPDVAQTVRKLEIEGAVLDAKEILDLAELLDRASDARAVLTAAVERFPRLGKKAEGIGDFRDLLRDLAGKIEPDGRIADHASVALNRIRRDIEKQQRSIHESLERFLRAHREDGILQEEFVTIRNDRFVVPVVAGQKRRIDGVIHGASGSGQTLFVEPMETIALNNDLVRLTEEEMREVHRILREMTARLRVFAPSISLTKALMGELELLFAKADFAVDFDCVVPRFSPEGARRLSILEARHPLLEDVLRRKRARVVPVSLALEGGSRMLLISGPNTGGKTVSMKTAGLLALMAQSGLPVPCSAAEFPIFDAVLADIGDNQSIQESLSTFSAHITRVREMVEEATPDSLVLLDELGRATDPEEGGALGVAILERFRTSGAFTLASTHLMALKVYGATTEGVVNGSMGFDEETLEPTYVLRLGAPGKSAGLEIASRLGMPRELIEKARATLSGAGRDMGRFLAELRQRLEETAELQQRLEREHAALAERERMLAKESERREAEKIRELEKRFAAVMDKFDAQARETIESISESVQSRKAAEQARLKVAKARREVRSEVQTAITPSGAQRQSAAGKLAITEGVRVRLENVREPARVLRMLSGDRIEVQAGFMKMQVSKDDVTEVLPQGEDRARLPKNVSFQPGPTWDVSFREINVIGRHAEEAAEEVDKFLDSAVMASVQRVRIVHGHGMGVLKKAVAELLSKNPHVEKYYPAAANEGGTGATIVELKEG